VPLARDRRTSKGCPGVALRASRGTAIISLIVTVTKLKQLTVVKLEPITGPMLFLN
jgi:hypothetical protein